MTNEKPVKEPLFHIVRRESLPKRKIVLIYAVAIITALFLVGIFCSVCSTYGKTPFDMFGSMFYGNFGTKNMTWDFLRSVMILIGVSLALLPAFKMKFWNLGANGQIVISALVTFALMRRGVDGNLSRALVIPLMIILGILAGVVWAAIPAIFKAFFRTNESLFTLMMNYIAEGLVTVMITVWEPKGSGSLSPINDYSLIDIGNQYFLPILVVALLFVAMYFYLTKSKHGYELSLVGESENSAKYAGVNVKKVFIRTLILSGAICGLVGVLLAGDVNRVVNTNIHNNMGFTAIMTVWLAGFNPITTIFTCVLITAISKGMVQVRQDFGFTNDAIANVALGFTYFFIIACFFFINYKVIFRKSNKKVKAEIAIEQKTGTEGGKA